MHRNPRNASNRGMKRSNLGAPLCEGCEEAPATHTLPEVGRVCDSCFEVPDIVYETVLERVQTAISQVREFLGDL